MAPRRCQALSLAIAVAFALTSARSARAQQSQSITEVLSFLMTNRSIPTDDFVRDEQAAIATSNAISNLLVLELASLPSSSAAGFSYRLDPALGTVIRSSDSFGPVYTERALMAGRDRASLGVSYRSTMFDNIDGRNLRDGTLLSTASILTGDAAPFDVETVSLRIRTDAMTVTGTYGITDRLDVTAGLPFVRVTLQGERVDTYRGRRLLQAAGSATAAGIGDLVLRGRYNVYRDGASGVSIGAELRVPTGREEDLLGTGQAAITPRIIASYEGDRAGVHGEFGYSFDKVANAVSYSAAGTVVAAPRVTLIGELLGRRLDGLGRLVETTLPHPRLAGVETIRLTGSGETTERVDLVAGIKWNVGGTWLMTASVLRALTSVGLNANWVPSLTFDYWFGE
ncbi:MAG TPA: transporter [Vicinamibacterales bacterium]|nr:transporter [Vicinamibacterales bacterium]